MSGSSGSREVDDILGWLRSLNEDQLRKFIKYFFERNLGSPVSIIHGTGEHGADIVATIDKNTDPLGKGQILLVQVKVNDVDLAGWRENLANQISELYYHRLRVPEVYLGQPRRMLLITSGEINPEANAAIFEWNNMLPIPIEVFSGYSFAEFLFNHNFRRTEIEEFNKAQSINWNW
ncbi:MAG: restriction endonuclease [Nitrososphaerales archaeon]